MFESKPVLYGVVLVLLAIPLAIRYWFRRRRRQALIELAQALSGTFRTESKSAAMGQHVLAEVDGCKVLVGDVARSTNRAGGTSSTSHWLGVEVTFPKHGPTYIGAPRKSKGETIDFSAHEEVGLTYQEVDGVQIECERVDDDIARRISSDPDLRRRLAMLVKDKGRIGGSRVRVERRFIHDGQELTDYVKNLVQLGNAI